MSMRRFTSVLLLLAWTGSVSAAQPSEHSQAASPDANRIHITAQSLVYRNQDNTAVFEGHVVLTKGVFTMHADQMIVFFEAGPASASSKDEGKAALPSNTASPDLPTFGSRAVSLINASGNVLLQQGEKKAKSHRAVYYQRDDKLVLTGDPEAWEEGYRVTGCKMTMFLKEDRSLVDCSRVVINDAEAKPR